MPFLDKKKQKIVYTDFQDQVTGVREEEVVYMPKMTGVQLRKRFRPTWRTTSTTSSSTVYEATSRSPRPICWDWKGPWRRSARTTARRLLTGLLARSEAPSLAHFVRNMVGMDRAAAQRAFSGFLSDQSLTPPQIRFVEMVIDQLTARGVMEASALYEPPFSNLHAGGRRHCLAERKT